jgi:hypothetical protein
MVEVKVIDVVETTSPNCHLIDLLRLFLLLGIVVDETEDSNEDLAHGVDELISMSDD